MLLGFIFYLPKGNDGMMFYLFNISKGSRIVRELSNEFPKWFAFMVGVLFDFSKNMSASAAHILSELLKVAL